MTSNEVFTSLFWIVAGGYMIYVGWTCYQLVAYSSARRRHPSSRKTQSRSSHLANMKPDD